MRNLLKKHFIQSNRRGTVLIAAVSVIAVISLIMVAVLEQGNANAIYSNQQVQNKQLHYAASSGISQVRYFVGSSAYNGAGNAWLRDTGNIMNAGVVVPIPPVLNLVDAIRNQSPVTVKNPAQLQWDLARIRVRVYVYAVGQGLYRAISIARHLVTGHVVAKALDMRERATFARYIFFREQGLYFGSTTTAGDVHSNDVVRFSEEFHSYGPLTATDGFAYTRNAIAPGQPGENVFFHEFSDGQAADRDRPVVQDLQELKNSVISKSSPFMMEGTPETNNYWRSTHNLTSIQSIDKMHFRGHNVEIQVTGTNSSGNSVTTPVQNFTLPNEGLIYVEKQVKSLEGFISGRVTLAVDYGNDADQSPNSSNESVRLTGNLIYQDSNGEHPYELFPVDSEGNRGAPIADLNSTGNYVPWDQANGYIYDSNPNYLVNANETVPPVLGIIAKGRIRTTENAPHNMVFHGATISINSAWTSTYHGSLAPGNPSSDSLKKGNWRHLGAKIAKGGGGRYSTSGSYPYPGYSASGEYLYDLRLRSFPPPHFLGEDRPSFGSPYDVTKNGTNTSF